MVGFLRPHKHYLPLLALLVYKSPLSSLVLGHISIVSIGAYRTFTSPSRSTSSTSFQAQSTSSFVSFPDPPASPSLQKTPRKVLVNYDLSRFFLQPVPFHSLQFLRHATFGNGILHPLALEKVFTMVFGNESSWGTLHIRIKLQGGSKNLPFGTYFCPLLPCISYCTRTVS
jgi:hypothetical protein